jgi:hypothetical protein
MQGSILGSLDRLLREPIRERNVRLNQLIQQGNEWIENCGLKLPK